MNFLLIGRVLICGAISVAFGASFAQGLTGTGLTPLSGAEQFLRASDPDLGAQYMYRQLNDQKIAAQPRLVPQPQVIDPASVRTPAKATPVKPESSISSRELPALKRTVAAPARSSSSSSGSLYENGLNSLSEITRSLSPTLENIPIERMTADQRDAMKLKLQQEQVRLQGLQYERQGEQVHEAVILNRISASTSAASWANFGVNFAGSKAAEKVMGIFGKKTKPSEFPPIVP